MPVTFSPHQMVQPRLTKLYLGAAVITELCALSQFRLAVIALYLLLAGSAFTTEPGAFFQDRVALDAVGGGHNHRRATVIAELRSSGICGSALWTLGRGA